MLCRVAFAMALGVFACGPEGGHQVDPDAGPGSGSDDGGVPGANGEDQPIQFTSGTRIKARTTTTMITTADGASYKSTTFAGWYDAERNEACSPQLAADGKTRCIPAASPTFGYYADAACTMPVTFASTPTPVCGASGTLKYISVAPPPACPTTVGPRIYLAGSIGNTYYIKSTSNGTCSGPNMLEGYTFAALGTEVPAAEFVEMTTATSMQ